MQTYPNVIPNKDFLVNVSAGSVSEATGVAYEMHYFCKEVSACRKINTTSPGKDLVSRYFFVDDLLLNIVSQLFRVH